jgi:hypothetical protein
MAGLIIGLVVAAGVFVTVDAPLGSSRPQRPVQGPAPTPQFGWPCPNGRLEALNTLPDLAAFPLLLPRDDLANARSVTAAYWCPISTDDGQWDGYPVLQFESGLVLRQFETQLAEPARTWSSLATQDKGSNTGAARGHSALVVSPSPSSGRKGTVEFVESGVQVVLIGNGSATAADLLRVSESMRAFD